jgi:hypothetical protein
MLLKFFVSCCFRKNFISVQFFLLLDFAAYKKIVISFGFCPKYISCIKKEKIKKKVVQKDIYWFLPQKTKQGKIGSNQLRINSNLRI